MALVLVLALALVGSAGCTAAPAPSPTPVAPTVSPAPSPSPSVAPATPTASPSLPPAPRTPPAGSRSTSSVATLARSRSAVILSSLIRRQGADDPRYYSDKVWQDGTAQCFRCTMGPALLAAAYTAGSGDDDYRQVAIDSLDEAIATHQQPDGSFGPPAPAEDGRGIQTVLFANTLASAYLMLRPGLDNRHRAAWSAALTRSADFLIAQNFLAYYVNGNINLAVSVNLDLVARITGQPRFRRAAARSLAFALRPPQDRWPGFGLTYAKRPTRSDGADGAAYLAESGGGTPGYDPAYTQNQADIASAWYLLTGSAAARRLTNLLFNQLRPRVRTSDWTLDVSGGTRKGKPGTRYGFYGPALAVLALRGGRSDLRRWVSSQTSRSLTEFRGATGYANATLSNSYGAELAPLLFVLTHRPAS